MRRLDDEAEIGVYVIGVVAVGAASLGVPLWLVGVSVVCAGLMLGCVLSWISRNEMPGSLDAVNFLFAAGVLAFALGLMQVYLLWWKGR